MNRFSTGPARLMIVSAVIWFLVDLLFAQVTQMMLGVVLLAIVGFCQSTCMTPLAAVMLMCSDPAYRGRVMGMRMLAIWGLPTGLMISGPLINAIGFNATVTISSLMGACLTVLIAWRWRQQLWSAQAGVNTNTALRGV